MRSRYFPPLDKADEQGFLCWSPDLNIDYVQDAYRNAIFPWPQSEDEILWFSPPERGLLFFDKLRINRSLSKVIRKLGTDLEYKKNHNFSEVIKNCRSQPRPEQQGTWITNKMQKVYFELHQKGYAHSFEVYRDKKMVAGVYGVFFGKYFSAESMFFHEPNTSKLALLKLISYLKSKGLKWLDIQMLTPVTESLGGEYITRVDFTRLIQEANFYPPAGLAGQELLV